MHKLHILSKYMVLHFDDVYSNSKKNKYNGYTELCHIFVALHYCSSTKSLKNSFCEF